MTHRFPCQDACAPEPVDQFFSCQVLQLLTLEAASRKRLSSFLSLRSKPLQSNASSKGIYAPDADSSPRKPGSLSMNLFKNSAALLQTVNDPRALEVRPLLLLRRARRVFGSPILGRS